MRHRGSWPWGIQTGPFAACENDFVPSNFHLFTMPPIIDHFLLPQREEGRKEQGQKMGKGNSPKVKGFLVPWALKKRRNSWIPIYGRWPTPNLTPRDAFISPSLRVMRRAIWISRPFRILFILCSDSNFQTSLTHQIYFLWQISLSGLLEQSI